MKAVSDLTEGELVAALMDATDVSDALCAEFIACGRGHEKPSETRTKTDLLAQRYNAHAVIYGALLFERERRKTYHGSLKRIRSHV